MSAHNKKHDIVNTEDHTGSNNIGDAGKVLTTDGEGGLSWGVDSGGADWKLDGNTEGAEKSLGTTDNFDLPFITNNTEKARLLANGNFGIGISPLHKLDVDGAIRIGDGTGIAAGTWYEMNGADRMFDGFDVGSSTDYRTYSVAAAGNIYRANIDTAKFAFNDVQSISSTNSPYQFVIGSSPANPFALAIERQTNTVTDLLGITFNMYNSINGTVPYSRLDTEIISNTNALEDGDLIFKNIGSGILNESVRIRYNGNVGIDTATPDAKLEIKGSSAGAGTFGLKIKNTSNDLLLSVNDEGFSSFYNRNGGEVARFGTVGFGDPAITLNDGGFELLRIKSYRTAGNEARFKVNGIENFRISGQGAGFGFSDNSKRLMVYNDAALDYTFTAQNSVAPNEGLIVNNVGNVAIGTVLSAGTPAVAETELYVAGTHRQAKTLYTGATVGGQLIDSHKSEFQTAYWDGAASQNRLMYSKGVQIDTAPTEKIAWYNNADAEIFSIISDSTIKYIDGNQGAGKVLTSDASGVATWQAAAGGGVAGSGTLNYHAKWTPDGVTLGDSLIIDDGTNVGLNSAISAGSTLALATNAADTKGISVNATNVTGAAADGISVNLIGPDNSQMYGVRGSAKATFAGNGNTEAVGLLGLAIQDGRTNIGIRGEGKNGSASSYGISGVINSGATVVPAFGTAAFQGGNASSNGAINYGVQLNNTPTAPSSTAVGVGVNMAESAAVTTSIGLRLNFPGGAGTKYGAISDGDARWGVNTLTPDADKMMHIKGLSSGASTYGLSVKNNSNLQGFTVRDDGRVGVVRNNGYITTALNVQGINPTSDYLTFYKNNGNPVAYLGHNSNGGALILNDDTSGFRRVNINGDLLENNDFIKTGRNLSLNTTDGTQGTFSVQGSVAVLNNDIGQLTEGVRQIILHSTDTNGGYIEGIRGRFGFGPEYKFSVNNPAQTHDLIDTGRNLGIGTSTPTVKLDVVGDVNTSTQYKVGGVAGFTGTGAYTNFTIVGGIITAAS